MGRRATVLSVAWHCLPVRIGDFPFSEGQIVVRNVAGKPLPIEFPRGLYYKENEFPPPLDLSP